MPPNVKILLVLLIIAGSSYLGYDYGCQKTENYYVKRDNHQLEKSRSKILELQSQITSLEYDLKQKQDRIKKDQENFDKRVEEYVAELSDPNRSIIGSGGLRLYNEARSGKLPGSGP